MVVRIRQKYAFGRQRQGYTIEIDACEDPTAEIAANTPIKQIKKKKISVVAKRLKILSSANIMRTCTNVYVYVCTYTHMCVFLCNTCIGSEHAIRLIKARPLMKNSNSPSAGTAALVALIRQTYVRILIIFDVRVEERNQRFFLFLLFIYYSIFYPFVDLLTPTYDPYTVHRLRCTTPKHTHTHHAGSV